MFRVVNNLVFIYFNTGSNNVHHGLSTLTIAFMVEAGGIEIDIFRGKAFSYIGRMVSPNAAFVGSQVRILGCHAYHFRVVDTRPIRNISTWGLDILRWFPNPLLPRSLRWLMYTLIHRSSSQLKLLLIMVRSQHRVQMQYYENLT